MLLDAVREYVSLSGMGGIKSSDQRVKDHMVLLRRYGFSSNEISELSGGKWSGSLVRQRTKDWGGVDEEMNEERKSIMMVLSEFASKRYEVRDIEYVLGLDRLVKSKGSSLGEVAELDAALRKLGLQSGDGGRILSVAREMLGRHIDLGELEFWMRLDQELVRDGFDEDARSRILKTSRKLGGVHKLLDVIEGYDSLYELSVASEGLRDEVGQLIAVKQELDIRISENEDMINEVYAARLAGFNTFYLSRISGLTRSWGGVIKVIDGIKKYGSVREIDDELESKKAELEKLESDIKNKSATWGVLRASLREVKEVYLKNSVITSAVELIENPSGSKMDRDEVLGFLVLVLDSCILRLDENPMYLTTDDPHWSATYNSIKALRKRLMAT